MKLFFENISQSERIPVDAPMEAGIEQALDVFEQLPEDDGSSFGLVDDNGIIIQIFKYNRFMWIIEIVDEQKEGSWCAICNKNQVVKALERMFNGEHPLTVADFKFEKF